MSVDRPLSRSRRALPRYVHLAAALSLPILACLWWAAPVRADYPQFLVNDDTIGEEHRLDPAVTPLPDGGFLAAWVDNGRGHTDINALRLDAALAPIGEPTRLNSDGGLFAHSSVRLSAARAGRVWATWIDERGGRPQIYARPLSAVDGAAVGADFAVDTTPAGLLSLPSVAINSNGDALLTWAAQPGAIVRIFFRWIDADGDPLGPVTELDQENVVTTQGNPAVAALPDDRWLVAWDEQTSLTRNIFYRILDADLGGASDIVQADGDQIGLSDQSDPAVLVRANDILIAWTDSREGSGDLWGHWLGLDGVREAGPDTRLREASDPSPDLEARLVGADDGSFVLSWLGSAGTSPRAYWRLFDSDRNGAGPSEPIDAAAPGVHTRSADVVVSGPGEWLALFSDNRTLWSQVYAKRRDFENPASTEITPIWSAPGSGSQLAPDVALFPDLSAVVVWAGLESGLLNVYARMLDTAGLPTGASFQVNEIPVNHGISTVDGFEAIPQFAPWTAACSTGFVVTWSVNEGGGRLGVYGQLFDRDANRLGGNFRIPPPSRDEVPQSDARPVMLSDGRFAIAWRDNSVDDGGDIFLQYFSEDGLREGDPIDLIDNIDGARNFRQQLPSIAVSPFDEIVVGWIDHRFRSWDIFLQKVSPLGTLNGPNEPQHTVPDGVTEDQARPVVANGEDRTVAVWEELPLTLGLIRGRLTVLETARDDGSPPRTASSLPITDFSANDDRPLQLGNKFVDVGVDESGRFLVTWWENHDGDSRLWARRYEPTGLPNGPRYDLSEATAGSRLPAHIDVGPGVIQVVWSDSRRDRGWDVYTRRIDWAFAGGPVPVLVSGFESSSLSEGVELTWRASSDRPGEDFHVWRQESGLGGTAPAASARRITAEPLSPASGVYRIVDSEPIAGLWADYFLEALALDGTSEFIGPFPILYSAVDNVARLWPNPSRGAVTLAPPPAGRYELEVRDVAGRLVRLSADRSDGRTPIVWDGRDTRGRLVPAGMYFVRAAPNEQPSKVLLLR